MCFYLPHFYYLTPNETANDTTLNSQPFQLTHPSSVSFPAINTCLPHHFSSFLHFSFFSYLTHFPGFDYFALLNSLLTIIIIITSTANTIYTISNSSNHVSSSVII